MASDLRSALRSLGRSPGFRAVVRLIAAPGVGAKSAIFPVVRSLVLWAPPREDPGRVARLDTAPILAATARADPIVALRAE